MTQERFAINSVQIGERDNKLMGYITDQGLKELLNYKYKPGGYTWLDNKMNYFWEALVKLVPLWMAPNLITFVGWILVILSYANMLRYDYTFQKDIPASAFFFAAGCIFTYMNLDAIDGKQARRTQTSSPLGQLFDHGCDSFSIGFFMLAICQATKLEKEEVFLLFIASQASFWTANWTEYNTGVLKTKVGQFGVTEAEFTCMFIHILTGIFGQSMWQISLKALLGIPSAFIESLPPTIGNLLSINLGSATVYFYSTLLFLIVAYSIVHTIIASQDKKRSAAEFFSFLLLISMELTWSHTAIYAKYNGIILVNFALIASTLICKMIICSVTKMRFQYFHFELIPLGLATIALVFLDVTGLSTKTMVTVFWASFAANLLLILNFLTTSIKQITQFLGIYCFSIKKRPKLE